MIGVNLNKAKLISHDIRRSKRSEEFEPLDSLIMKQIPGTNFTDVETQRQQIRDKYAVIQNSINSANTAEELLTIVKSL